MSKLRNDVFLYLADARDGTDLKQDQYVALLEAAPQTEDEALAILRTVHHRHERSLRNGRRTLQLAFDPVAPQAEEENGILISALDLLPAKEQAIIRSHVIDGISLSDIAVQQGVSRRTMLRRYTGAKNKLAAMLRLVQENAYIAVAVEPPRRPR